MLIQSYEFDFHMQYFIEKVLDFNFFRIRIRFANVIKS